MLQALVSLVAAEILNSSHCVRLPSGVLCSCESQGNPVPTLTWTLDGEAVDHSAHRPIREYKSGNLGVMSVISLPQSDKDPPTVMCLSNNSMGDNRLELNFAFSKSEPGRSFHPSSISRSIHPSIIPSSFNPFNLPLIFIHLLICIHQLSTIYPSFDLSIPK